jgi:hypothetical protein
MSQRLRREGPPPGEAITTISSTRGDVFSLRVAVPVGKEGWLSLGGDDSGVGIATDRGDGMGGMGGMGGKGSSVCAVEGCEERRKYRCTKKFEIGGCSLVHLQQVNATLM